jgi:hypothetical protein
MFAAGLLAAGVVVWRRSPGPAEPATLTPLKAAVPMVLAAAAIATIALMGR